MSEEAKRDHAKSDEREDKTASLPESGLACDVLNTGGAESAGPDSSHSQSPLALEHSSILAFASGYGGESIRSEADGDLGALGTWVTFALGAETYAMPVSHVQEILRVGTITRVPQAPPAVRGITNVRGRVVPVVDLRVHLDFDAAEIGAHSRILYATVGTTSLGLLVDSVDQVINLTSRDVESAPAESVDQHTAYIAGVAQREDALVILLDPDQLLRLGPRATPA